MLGITVRGAFDTPSDRGLGSGEQRTRHTAVGLHPDERAREVLFSIRCARTLLPRARPHPWLDCPMTGAAAPSSRRSRRPWMAADSR